MSLTPVKKSSDQLDSSHRRKGAHVNVSIDPPQISLQQMEQMARGGVYDMDMMTDLMQQPQVQLHSMMQQMWQQRLVMVLCLL